MTCFYSCSCFFSRQPLYIFADSISLIHLPPLPTSSMQSGMRTADEAVANLLQVPNETAGWAVLHEGYLNRGTAKCLSTRAVTSAASCCRSHTPTPHTRASAQGLLLDKGQTHVLSAQAEPARVTRRTRILLGCDAERPTGADGEKTSAPLEHVKKREVGFGEFKKVCERTDYFPRLSSATSPHVTCCPARRRGALTCKLTMARCMLFTWTSGKQSTRPGTRWARIAEKVHSFFSCDDPRLCTFPNPAGCWCCSRLSSRSATALSSRLVLSP